MFTTVIQSGLHSLGKTDASFIHMQFWESQWVPHHITGQKEPSLLTQTSSTHQETTQILFGDTESKRLPPQQSLRTRCLLEALTQLQVPRDRPQTERNIQRSPVRAKPPERQQQDTGCHLGGFLSARKLLLQTASPSFALESILSRAP